MKGREILFVLLFIVNLSNQVPHLKVNVPLAWYVSPIHEEHTYIYNKLDQIYFPNNIGKSNLKENPVDYLIIRIQNLEIIKGQLVYPLVSIQVKNVNDIDSRRWQPYPETPYTDYDEPFIIIPLQEYDIFMITIKWNPNAFQESNTYDVLAYNPVNTNIVLNNELFVNLNPEKHNNLAKVNEKNNKIVLKNDETFKSYENRQDISLVTGIIVFEIMICQNIPDNLILSEVTVLNEGTYFDDPSNNVKKRVVLADFNKMLGNDTYGIIRIHPNPEAKYLSLRYDIQNGLQTTFRVHTKVYGNKKDAQLEYMIKSERFDVQIEDVFKETFTYEYPDFIGIGNWHFYASFIYSANKEEFQYRSMCGFSDNTFYYYNQELKNKSVSNQEKMQETKQTEVKKVSTKIEIVENKIAESNKKDSSPKNEHLKKRSSYKKTGYSYNLLSIIDPLIPKDCCKLYILDNLGKMKDLYRSLNGGDRYVIVKLIGDQKRFLRERNFDSFTIFSSIKKFEVFKRSEHFIILLMALIMTALFLMSISMYYVIKGIKDRMKSDVEEQIASKKNRIIQALQKEWKHEINVSPLAFKFGKRELEKISEQPSMDEGSQTGSLSMPLESPAFSVGMKGFNSQRKTSAINEDGTPRKSNDFNLESLREKHQPPKRQRSTHVPKIRTPDNMNREADNVRKTHKKRLTLDENQVGIDNSEDNNMDERKKKHTKSNTGSPKVDVPGSPYIHDLNDTNHSKPGKTKKNNTEKSKDNSYDARKEDNFNSNDPDQFNTEFTQSNMTQNEISETLKTEITDRIRRNNQN